MKPELERAIQGLLRLGKPDKPRFDDRDLIPFVEPDNSYGCEIRESIGGRWILAPDQASAWSWLADHEHDSVFTRAELRTISYDLHTMNADERRTWLGDILTLKSVLPDATILSITFRDPMSRSSTG